MKDNLSDITLVLDRSGSMASIANDTIGGVNSFIKDQQKVPGECLFTLCQFDTIYENVVSTVNLNDAPLLTPLTFVPRGGTALFDAIARTIIDTGNRLSNMSESDRPSKVIFVIMTDGEENSSKEYPLHPLLGGVSSSSFKPGNERIKEMIEHQSSVYKWEFVYLGANQDAFSVAGSIGILQSNTANYMPTSADVGHVWNDGSVGIANLRCGNIASGQGVYGSSGRK